MSMHYIQDALERLNSGNIQTVNCILSFRNGKFYASIQCRTTGVVHPMGAMSTLEEGLAVAVERLEDVAEKWVNEEVKSELQR